MKPSNSHFQRETQTNRPCFTLDGLFGLLRLLVMLQQAQIRRFKDLISRTPNGVPPRNQQKQGSVTKYFNPRTPNEVRPPARRDISPGFRISIHALLTKCDAEGFFGTPSLYQFQSTHSKRSATLKCIEDRPKVNFNPRTPNGVRQRKYT